jgi:hypothetical protein
MNNVFKKHPKKHIYECMKKINKQLERMNLWLTYQNSNVLLIADNYFSRDEMTCPRAAAGLQNKCTYSVIIVNQC